MVKIVILRILEDGVYAEILKWYCIDIGNRLQKEYSINKTGKGTAMPFFALLLLKVSLFIVGGHAAICSDGFTLVGDSCYFLSLQDKNWLVANRTCIEMGGYLVTINSAEENNDLFQWLRDDEYFQWDEWFLGPYIGIYQTGDETDKFGFVELNKMHYID